MNLLDLKPDQEAEAPSPGQRLLRLGVLALACWGTAWLGVLMSTWPMSYASGVWPAAGVGLAGLLLLGRPAWPAVWLGRALFELGFQAPQAGLDWPSLIWAASAVTAQAWLGAWLVARHVRLPTRLREAGKLVRLMGLGAASSVISPSLQLPWLAWQGRLVWEQLPAQWLTWLLGDLMGIALVMPLALLWAIPGGWRQLRKWVVSAWVGLALGVSLGGSYLATRWETQVLDGLVRRQALEAHRALGAELAQLEQHLRTLALLPPGPRQQQAAAVFNSERGHLAFLAWLPASSDESQWASLLRQGPDGACAEQTPGAWRQLLGLPTGRPPELWSGVLPGAEGLSCLVAAWPTDAGWVLALVDSRQLAMRTLRAWQFHESLGSAGLFEAPRGLVGRLNAAGVGEARPVFETRHHPSSEGPLQAWAPSRALPQERFDLLFGPMQLSLSVVGEANFWALNATGLPALVFTGGMALSVAVLLFMLEVTGRSELLEDTVRRKTVELDQSLMLLEETAEGYQHQSEQFRMLLRSTPVGFLAFAADDRVLLANEAMADILGLSPEALRGMDRQGLCEALKQLSVDGPELVEGLLCSQGDEAMDVRLNLGTEGGRAAPERVLSVVKSQVSDEEVRSVYLFTDITEAARLERSKSIFISNIAHEVRTPLTSIIGYTELLLHRLGMGEEMRSRMLGDVACKAKDLQRLMGAMLDLTELENLGREGLPCRPQPLADAVVRALSLYQLPAGRQPPQIELPDEPLVAAIHVNKLGLALRHLIENAYAFSGPDTAVRLSLTPGHDAQGRAVARLCLRDQGVGIAAEQLPQVFERFYRADNSGEKPGFGLGLSIVREIVKLHQARIELDSRPGQGTEVTLELLLVPAADGGA